MRCDAPCNAKIRRKTLRRFSTVTGVPLREALCCCCLLLFMITTYSGNGTATRGGGLGGGVQSCAPRAQAGAGVGSARPQCRLAPCVAPARRVSATEDSLWGADASCERAQRPTSSGLASSSPAAAARRAFRCVSAQAGQHECVTAAGVGERRGVPRLEALGLHRRDSGTNLGPRAKVSAPAAREKCFWGA
jgi:hypothetical protein